MRAWAFVVVSALLQVGWLESLRRTEGFRRVIPLVWYLLFGASSTYALSRSLESLPLSTAYAAWTALSVAGSVVFDRAIGRGPIGSARLACILVIVGATACLRLIPERP
ncbi:MAG TPA: SMR family transporter [Gemmatimonadales bacterium]|nr:SMR family transporter [Gemmatimonadales bacterium]